MRAHEHPNALPKRASSHARRARALMITVLAGVLLAAAGCEAPSDEAVSEWAHDFAAGCYFGCVARRARARETARSFLDALAAGDYATALALTTPSYRERATVESFTSLVEDLPLAGHRGCAFQDKVDWAATWLVRDVHPNTYVSIDEADGDSEPFVEEVVAAGHGAMLF